MEIVQKIFVSTTEELKELLTAQLPEGVKIIFNEIEHNVYDTKQGRVITPMKIGEIER